MDAENASHPQAGEPQGSPAMRRGVRIGVDVGQVRVGVASCDPDGIMATPVETMKRDKGGDADVRAVAELADETSAAEVVVGLPLNMSGHDTPSTKSARNWAKKLKSLRPGLRVVLVDERLTSVSAHRSLHASGLSMKEHRSRVDQQAAVLILQSALDTERATGRPTGVEVGGRKPRARRKTKDEGRQLDG